MATSAPDDADQASNTTSDMRSFERMFVDVIVFLSFAAIALSMMMTVADIVMRSAASVMSLFVGTRPKWGIFGLVDLTQLAVMTAVPLAIAATFFANAHIRIDLIFNIMSLTWRRFSLLLSAFVGFLVMGICLWTAWQEMRGQLEFTTTSATLGLPYTWYWAPLIAGLALSSLACLVGIVKALASKPAASVDDEHA